MLKRKWKRKGRRRRLVLNQEMQIRLRARRSEERRNKRKRLQIEQHPGANDSDASKICDTFDGILELSYQTTESIFEASGPRLWNVGLPLYSKSTTSASALVFWSLDCVTVDHNDKHVSKRYIPFCVTLILICLQGLSKFAGSYHRCPQSGVRTPDKFL